MSYIQSLIDSQNNIIIICDKKFNVKYINKTFYDFFKRERVNEIIKLVDNKEFDTEFEIKIKNYRNDKYIFLVKLSKVEDDITISLTNITKTSAYKKSLLQSNSNFLDYKNVIDKFLIVSKTDAKGIITYVNDKFVNISGYSKEELVGNPHNIVRHPDMPSYVFKKMWKTISQGKIWEGVIKNRKKDGTSYYVKTIIAPLFNTKNKIKEYIALRVDITELIKAKEKVQKAKKAKEMFLANMSHEIRTPLTGIMGFIDILKKKDLPDNIKYIINIIDNSADTLLNVVNDILELSKIESEGVTIHEDKFNPTKSFRNTIELFKAKVKEKHINYIYNINVSKCIISDEHRLRQVLSNLIGNAIKFTPNNGEVKVDIITRSIIRNKITIDFSIQDSGIGIPKEKQQNLFKPFKQVDDTISQNFGGTGLGLYISYQIIKKLGGELKVESKENEGSKFYFSLEFDMCKEEDIKKENKDSIKVKGKVLIAEDDKVNQELLKAILSFKGDIDTTIVNNGQEALEIFKKEKFDLVFLDIFMPIMNGEEAVKEILKYEKENNLSHIPIVALTANALDGDKEKFLKLGFDGYISKPIKNEELDEVLLKYLHSENMVLDIAKSMELDENVIKDLLNIYFNNIGTDLNNLKYAIKTYNLEEIRNVSHKMAGASSSIRLEQVYNISKQIENYAKEKKEINYENLFNSLLKAIEKYKQQL